MRYVQNDEAAASQCMEEEEEEEEEPGLAGGWGSVESADGERVELNVIVGVWLRAYLRSIAQADRRSIA